MCFLCPLVKQQPAGRNQTPAFLRYISTQNGGIRHRRVSTFQEAKTCCAPPVSLSLSRKHMEQICRLAGPRPATSHRHTKNGPNIRPFSPSASPPSSTLSPNSTLDFTSFTPQRRVFQRERRNPPMENVRMDNVRMPCVFVACRSACLPPSEDEGHGSQQLEEVRPFLKAERKPSLEESVALRFLSSTVTQYGVFDSI